MAYGLTQSLDLEQTSSQYASASDSASLSITSNFTIEAWINLESLASTIGAQEHIVSKGDFTLDGAQYRLFINDSDDKLYCQFTNTAGANSTLFSMDEAFVSGDLGNWIHVAAVATIATPTIVFYKNGVLKSGTSSSTGATTISDNAHALFVGAALDSGSAFRFFDGKVSLVRVWSTAVSGANIAANTCNVLGSTANLAAEWTLNNTLNDNSGNSNTLTAVNAPSFVVSVPGICVSTATTITHSLGMLGVGQ